MRVHHLVLTIASLTAATATVACSNDQAAVQSSSHFALNVAPLSLEAVAGASYGITVKSALPDPDNVVWSRAAITSAAYGDGAGAISYVGPCDASPGANPHRIEVVLESLSGTSGTIIDDSTYMNPAPAGAPVVVTADCAENQDVAVEINLTVMRSAQQGFFDVAVNFEDVFCSAKLDCRRGEDPIELLFDPADGTRKTTVVMGFACTSGAGEATWLHLSDAQIDCDGVPPMYFDPSGTPGNNGPLGPGPSFFETGIYRGLEELPGYDKCFWNAAFGINVGANAKNCRFRLTGTASSTSYQPTGATPPNTISPYLAWDVQLTDAAGALLCTTHPLNGPDSGVVAAYTPWTGTTFTHEWQCSPNAIVESARLGCTGVLPGGVLASCDPSPDGVSVTIGGIRSPTYALPEGYLVDFDSTCCANPCCSTPE